MGLDATARRRWLGGGALAGALVMLICGETVLQGRLKPFDFVIYWLLCFVLTGVAIIAAVRDLRALQRRTREQQRDLLQSALKEIENEAQRRQQATERGQRP
jgi:hypothetical protein